MKLDEALMVRQLKGGDVLAFNRLFEAYSGRLYSFGFKYLKSETDAEEMVQNVFFKIWKNHERLDADKSFKAYLFAIAFNEIRKYFRQRAALLDLVDCGPASDQTTESEIAYHSAMDRINELLGALPVRQRRIFEMSRFENLSAKEIAVELGISSKTVDNQVSEVIRYLRGSIGNSLGCLLLFTLFLK